MSGPRADRPSSSGLAITGIGMASSLGNAVTACAAARAGMSRPAPLPIPAGMDGEDPAWVTGHPCRLVRDFEGFGRLSYLTRLALGDLLSGWSAGPIPPSRLALLLNLPDSDERPLLQEHLAHANERALGTTESDLFVGGLHRLMEGQLDGVAIQILRQGHAGGWVALQQAAALLESGRADVCLVGGIDSYLDLPTLEWLEATRRLKTPNRAVGLMPGEGAAVLAIERLRDARARSVRVLAHIGPLSTAEEPFGYDDEEFLPQGKALSTVLCDVLQGNAARDQQMGVMITDLNGQDSRAMEWGNALVRSSSSFRRLREMRRWVPAVNFGDVGGATAAFLVCIAVRAFLRGYAQGREILLSCCSEQGLRAALVLKTPDEQATRGLGPA